MVYCIQYTGGDEGISLGKVERDEPLNQKVYRVIKEAILKGELEGGSRLVETQLASQLGTSRTPVREAIRRLAVEGLVELIPNQGAFVTKFSLKDIENVFQIRSVLEGLAVKLFAKRCGAEEIENLKRKLERMKKVAEERDVIAYSELDAEFHRFIWFSSGNERLSRMLESIVSYINTYRLRSLYITGVMEKSLEDHEKILELIIQRKAKEVEELMRLHVEGVLWRISEMGREEL
ncbi:MAG: hypothetical protein PWQ16_78 [bacterium]|nr:MAG: Transcriptional regulator, GntR family [bacterium 42_11]MDK2870726.1 hypothetical protein [bacterium]